MNLSITLMSKRWHDVKKGLPWNKFWIQYLERLPNYVRVFLQENENHIETEPHWVVIAIQSTNLEMACYIMPC